MFSEQEINEALKREQPSSYLPTRDDIGHGTFLAGVAAGNEIPGKEFSGIAPLSQIIVVKCKEAKNSYREYYRVPSKVPCYQENDIMAGIMYILQVAYSLGRPVSICVGMGQVSSPAPEMKVPPGIIMKLPKRKKKFRSTLRGRVLDLSANCGGRLPEVCRLM